MEKYTSLLKNYKCVYAENSPVLICARAIVKDNENGNVYAQLKFRNISDKNISAVKIGIKAFDTFGVEKEGVPEYQYLDLDEKRNAEFGGKKLVPLPDNQTRSFRVKCTEVMFSDGSAAKLPENAEWEELPEQEKLGEKFGGEIAEQYRRDTFGKAEFVPDFEKDIWRCACGAINRKTEQECSACKNKKEFQYLALDEEELRKNLAEYKRIKAGEEEKAKIAAEIQKRKNRKTAAIILPLIAVIIGATVLFTTVIRPNMDYDAALFLMEEGKYEEAISAFEAMEGYKDSVAQIEKCKAEITEIAYQGAVKLFESGNYEKAVTAFKELGDYKESGRYFSKADFFVKSGEAKTSLLSAGKTEIEKTISELLAIPGAEEETEILDECYIAAVNGLVSAMDDETAKVYLEKIEAKETEEYAALSQKVEYLGIYNEAKAIEIKNNSTKNQVKELCGKLPEDYPGRAELLEAVEEYEKKQGEEIYGKPGSLRERILKALQGTWVNKSGIKLVISGNTFTAYENGKVYVFRVIHKGVETRTTVTGTIRFTQKENGFCELEFFYANGKYAGSCGDFSGEDMLKTIKRGFLSRNICSAFGSDFGRP